MEGDLLDCLLEIQVVEDFERIAVDEQLVVSFNLGVTALDETLGARLLAALVAVEAESLDALHLVLPLLADDLEEPLRTDVLLIIVCIVRSVVVVVAAVHCILWRGTRSTNIWWLRLANSCRRIHVVIII